jgi:ferritin-like metal-binding protein YciE
MSLQESLLDEVRDLYHAEKQLLKALPKMAKAATHEDLREAMETHLEETQEQVKRLEKVFSALGKKPSAKPCHGMLGIIEENMEKMQELDRGSVLDAVLIAGAQRVEHYEIGSYGTAVAWARLLGLNEVASLLEQTLEEEKATDKKLTALAEQEINLDAASEGQQEEEAEEEEAAAPRRSRKTTTRRASSTRTPRAKAADRRRR